MDNLRLLRKRKGITMLQLAKEIGIGESTVSLYETGKRQPDYNTLAKLADYFGVTTDYLLGRSVTQFVPPYQNCYSLDTPIKLPVFGEIRAGTPIGTDQGDAEEWIFEDQAYSDGNHFVLRVSGDSMSPTIPEGAYVVIKAQHYADKGQIVACCLDNDCATLKRYYPQQDGSVILRAENPEAESYVVTNEQFNNGDACIIGIVREIKIKVR